MVAPPGAPGHGEHQDALRTLHERRGLCEVGGGGPAAERQALAVRVGNPEHPARAAGDLRHGLMAEVVQDLVKSGVHRRKGRQLPDQGVALREGLLAQDRPALGVHGRAAHQVPVTVGEGLL